MLLDKSAYIFFHFVFCFTSPHHFSQTSEFIPIFVNIDRCSENDVFCKYQNSNVNVQMSTSQHKRSIYGQAISQTNCSLFGLIVVVYFIKMYFFFCSFSLSLAFSFISYISLQRKLVFLQIFKSIVSISFTFTFFSVLMVYRL